MAGMKKATAICFLALSFFSMLHGASATFALFKCNEGEIVRCSDTKNYYQYSGNCLVKIAPWTGILAHHSCKQAELPTNRYPIKAGFCPRFNDNDYSKCGHTSEVFKWQQGSKQLRKVQGSVSSINRGIWGHEFLDHCNRGPVLIIEKVVGGLLGALGNLLGGIKHVFAKFECLEGHIIRCTDTNEYYQYSKNCLVKISPWSGISAHHSCKKAELPTNRYPVKGAFCPSFSDRDFCKSGKSSYVYQWKQGSKELCQVHGSVSNINRGVWGEEFLGQCTHGQPINV